MVWNDRFEALGDIYDAAVNPGRWRRALDGVTSAIDAKAIALMIRQPDSDTKDRQMLSSAYLDFSRSVQGVYYLLRHSHHQSRDWAFLAGQKSHYIVRDTEMGISADVLDRRADYQFLRRKIGVSRRVGVRLNGDAAWFDAISIGFDAKQAHVPETQLVQLQPFLSHLTKAVELGRTFTELKRRYAAVLTALDHVHVGLVIALPNGEVIVQNAEAQRIFDLKDGLRLNPRQHLQCKSNEETSALSAAIRQLGLTVKGEAELHEFHLSVRRPSGSNPYLIEIAPLKDSKDSVGLKLEGTLVTIIDPDNLPKLKIRKLAELYRLTPSELEVCELLIRGNDQETIAEKRNTSPVTVKNQISAILAKTDVGNRAALVRLAIRIMPPVG